MAALLLIAPLVLIGVNTVVRLRVSEYELIGKFLRAYHLVIGAAKHIVPLCTLPPCFGMYLLLCVMLPEYRKMPNYSVPGSYSIATVLMHSTVSKGSDGGEAKLGCFQMLHVDV